MKGKILGSLFALPFAGVGVWMLWSISSTFYDAWQMHDWTPVPAQLTSAGYETRSGDDSDTFKAYAEYTYSYQGRHYTGNRVTIAGGADNIGDYQRDTGRHLQSAHARREPITVYVDPAEPSRSIIDPGIRWGMIGFKMIFVIVFGGVGFGLLIAIWRAPEEKDTSDPAYKDKPWLVNSDWQTETIRSGSRTSMWTAWVFAVFWNAISSVAPFIAYREIVENGNWIVLIALLFPLVGVGLLVWAVRRTLEWRRFGAAPVTLDPFPGSIGGHVGGTIDVNLPFDPATTFRLTLTNVHSYESGDSQSEKAKWQDSIIAHAEPGGKGTRLTFRFDVPEGLHESDAEKSGDYYVWRLALAAELPGTDLDRTYELPVYPTAEQSRYLPARSVERARSEQTSIDETSVRDRINLGYGAGGKRMFFPMGRHFGNAFGGLLVGGIFAAIGWYMASAEDHTILGSVFGGVGALIALSAFYMLFNSLEVLQTGTDLKTTRRVLGIPIRSRQVHRDEIVELRKHSNFQTQSGGKHIIYYKIQAVDRAGKALIIGEGFKGESEAETAIRLIAREFGLRSSQNTEVQGAGTGMLGREALS